MPHHRKIEILAPLFDRMVDEEPDVDQEAIPLRTLSIEGLKASIHHELTLLLNTRDSRIPLSVSAYNDNQPIRKPKSSYGFIDFSHFDVTQHVGQQKMVRHIKAAIDDYEPRLQKVSVEVKEFNHREQTIRVIVGGEVKVDALAERYTFPISIQYKD